MPSGAKKRKAAKRKKEKEANSANSATHTHGEDEMKVQDDKESDGGEVGSPASQDHHKHPFTGGEEKGTEKRERDSNVQSIASENAGVEGSTNEDSTQEEAMEVGNDFNRTSIQQEAMEENRTIQIDQDTKPENDADTKVVNVENIESVMESLGVQMSQNDGGSATTSSSSSSSSDNESHAVNESNVMIESVESKEEASKLVVESVAIADPVTTADLPEVTSLSDGAPVMDKYSLVSENPKEEAGDPVAVDAPAVNLVDPSDLPEVTPIMDGVQVIEASSLDVGKLQGEASNSVAETSPLVDSKNVCKELVHVNDGVQHAMSSNVTRYGLNENGKDENLGLLSVVADVVSQPEENKLSSTKDENPEAFSNVAGFAAQQDKDILLPSSIFPAVDTRSHGEHIKDSATIESSDVQPSVGSAPKRPTSWMSCCGLFEVFISSNR